MSFSPLPLLRNIRAARKQAMLTQEQMAEALGLTVLSYGMLERGERPISLKRLAQIADILHTTVYALLDGCVPGASPAQGLPGSASSIDELTDIIKGCSPEGRRLIRDIAWLIAGDYDL